MKEQFEPCACMGPQGNDPVCPCAMRQRGLKPTDNWTPDDVDRLRAVMDNWFKSRIDADQMTK